MDNFNFKNEATFLSSIDSTEFALIASILGILLSQNLSTNEINTIGNFLEAVGQVMLTIAAQEYLQQNNSYGNNNNNSNDFENRIKELEKEINELKKSRFKL